MPRARSTETPGSFPGLVARVTVAATVVVSCGLGAAAIAGTSAYAAPTPAPQDTVTATVEPSDPSASPSVSPTPTDSPSTPPPPTPTPRPTPTPTPTSSSPSPQPSVSASSSPVTTAPRPPAVAEAEPNPTSWLIALAVLLVAAVAVLLLVRRPVTDQPAVPNALLPAQLSEVGARGGTAARLDSLEAIGEAMLDAGYSVTGVRSALEDVATVNGYPATDVVVLPNALFVSARGVDEVSTGAVASGHRPPLMMNQIDALDDVVKKARTAPYDAAATAAAVAEARSLPPTYSPVQRVVAHALVSGSLAVLLGSSWTGVPLAMGLGVVVGIGLLLTAHVSRAQEALVTVGAAFVVSATVFGVTGAGVDGGVLAALLAPLAIFLPGGLLTTGVIELATGQMMSGAGRVAGGFMQLVLLATGVVAGATLVGIPAITFADPPNPIGPVGPWLAVGVFGVSMVIYRCGRAASIPWVLLVMYVAYGAQVIGAIFFGGVLSAMIGAFAMTPVAYLVSTRPTGPAAFTSFLPAFWMLVPGAVGLVGVASLMGGDSAGLNTIGTMAATMVGIALGILAGSMVGAMLAGRETAVAV